MQVTENKLNDLTHEFAIAVPAAAIEEKMTTRLGSLARNARLPGFRPGKVPLSLLRKRYEEALRGEVLEETIKASSVEVMTDRGLRPALTPKIEITSFEPGGDLQYKMAVEVLPEIEMPDFAAIELERLVAIPDEGEVDKTLARLADIRKQFAALSEPRPSQQGDRVVIDFVGRIDGEEFEGGRGEGYEVELGAGGFIPGFEDGLTGLSVGAHTELALVFPDSFPNEALQGKPVVFEIDLKEIREPQPVSLDDDFAKTLGAENLEALKATIREEHARELKALSRAHLKRKLLDRLAEDNTFAVPAGLVDGEYENVVRQLAGKDDAAADAVADNDTGHDHDHDHAGHDHGHDHDHAGHDHAGHEHTEHDHDHTDHDHGHAHGKPPADAALSEEQKAEYRALAERRVRLGLLLAEVGRANNVQVTAEELSKAIMTEARRYPGQEKTVIEFFRGNDSARKSLSAPLLEDKVIDFALEMAKVSEREIPLAELLAIDREDTPDDAEETVA